MGRVSNSTKVFLFALLLSQTSHAAGKIEHRCGWFANSSPSNAWLQDKDGEWEISVQGGYQAKGKWPEFNIDDEAEFVHTNGGSYGYGCVCLGVTTDPARKRILQIKLVKIENLTVCRTDKKLKEPDHPPH